MAKACIIDIGISICRGDYRVSGKSNSQSRVPVDIGYVIKSRDWKHSMKFSENIVQFTFVTNNYSETILQFEEYDRTLPDKLSVGRY